MQSTSLKLMICFQKTFLLSAGIWLIGGILGSLLQLDTFELDRTDWTGLNPLLLNVNAQQIIVNNLFVITVALLGFFTAGIISTFTLLINGFICIFCLKSILPFDFNLLNKLGIRCCYVIFECLAIWMSSAVGLMGLPSMTKLLRDSKLHISVKDIIFTIIVYLTAALLIVIAGLLESSAIMMLKEE